MQSFPETSPFTNPKNTKIIGTNKNAIEPKNTFTKLVISKEIESCKPQPISTVNSKCFVGFLKTSPLHLFH